MARSIVLRADRQLREMRIDCAQDPVERRDVRINRVSTRSKRPSLMSASQVIDLSSMASRSNSQRFTTRIVSGLSGLCSKMTMKPPGFSTRRISKPAPAVAPRGHDERRKRQPRSRTSLRGAGHESRHRSRTRPADFSSARFRLTKRKCLSRKAARHEAPATRGSFRPAPHVQHGSGCQSAAVLCHEVYEIVHLHAREEIDRGAGEAEGSINSVIVVATVRIELGMSRGHGHQDQFNQGVLDFASLLPNTRGAAVPRHSARNPDIGPERAFIGQSGIGGRGRAVPPTLTRFPLNLTHTLRHARPTGIRPSGRPGWRSVPGIHVCAAARKTWMAGTSGRSRPSSTSYARP